MLCSEFIPQMLLLEVLNLISKQKNSEYLQVLTAFIAVFRHLHACIGIETAHTPTTDLIALIQSEATLNKMLFHAA